jgi:hypothetical protein
LSGANTTTYQPSKHWNNNSNSAYVPYQKYAKPTGESNGPTENGSGKPYYPGGGYHRRHQPSQPTISSFIMTSLNKNQELNGKSTTYANQESATSQSGAQDNETNDKNDYQQQDDNRDGTVQVIWVFRPS